MYIVSLLTSFLMIYHCIVLTIVRLDINISIYINSIYSILTRVWRGKKNCFVRQNTKKRQINKKWEKLDWMINDFVCYYYYYLVHKGIIMKRFICCIKLNCLFRVIYSSYLLKWNENEQLNHTHRERLTGPWHDLFHIHFII